MSISNLPSRGGLLDSLRGNTESQVTIAKPEQPRFLGMGDASRHLEVHKVDNKRYRYIGTSITPEQLIEDKGGVYSYHSQFVTDIATRVYSVIKDRGLSDDVGYARKTADQKTDETRMKVKKIAESVLLDPKSYTLSVPGEVQDRVIMAEMLVNEVCGYGAIQPFYEDSRVSEIQVNSPYETFVEYRGEKIQAPGCQYANRRHLTETIQKIANTVGEQFDSKNAIVDVMLNDLSRVNAIHSSVSILGPNIAIRKHKRENFSMRDLKDFGSFSEEMARDIAHYFHHGLNVMVAGETGSGKTTLLTASLKLIPRKKRVVTIENTLELELDQPNILVLKSRRSEGAPVTEADLITACLRLTPDVICVGEVRRPEELSASLNAAKTGHTTVESIHSDSPQTTATRCMQMLTEEGMTEKGAALSFAGGVDIVIVQSKLSDGSRKVTYISEVLKQPKEEGGVVQVQFNDIWRFETFGVEKDENGRDVINGDFVKVGELSEELRNRYRIFDEPPLAEDVYKMTETGRPSAYERYEARAGGWNIGE